MGNKPSQEDQVHLLEEDEEIEPVFEELKLVLIGSQCVGKNSIGNAILRKKVFTFWKVRKHVDIKETRTVSGRRIHLTRTPGWKENWNSPEKTKRKIVHCVQCLYDTGPHAVLLALKVNSVLSTETISTLENFLTVHVWDHTIVIFTHGEKLDGYTIEDYIRRQRLQPLIDKCGQRYFVIEKKNHSNQITDTIEDLIASKNSVSCFKPNDQIKVDKLLSDWKHLVERIKSKIASISNFNERLYSTQNNDSIKELLDSKDAEIERLKSINEEKERKIERLQSICSRTQEDLLRRIDELEDQLKEKDAEIEELKKEKSMDRRTQEDLLRRIDELEHQLKGKDAEIEELKKEKSMDRRTHEDQYAHAGYRSQLAQDVTPVSTRSSPQIQLDDLPSKGSARHNWSETLLQILNELSNDELKRMQFFMYWNKEYNIPKGSLEGRDRVELAELMLKQWGKQQSVRNIRELMKKIPRNDEAIIKLFAPFTGETCRT